MLSIRAFGEDVCERKALRRVGKRKLGREGKKSVKRVKTAEEAAAAAGEAGEKGVEFQTAVGAEERKKGNEDEDMFDKDAEALEKDGGVSLLEHGEQSAASSRAPKGCQESDGLKEVDGEADEQGDHSTKDTKLVNGTGDSIPWKPKFRILDALSATGLRALRYAHEIPFATSITANDMLPAAAASIAMNVGHNKLSDKIDIVTSNAIAHMYSVAFPPTSSHGPDHISGKYDVIDLDPYGTAAPFIDAALHALNDGGLLCVTCTDSGVFASCGYSEKTYSLYGGLPIKGPHSHEGGLRLIIHSVASTAARYGMAIEPLLSLSIDYYVRIFIRVRKSPADVKFLAGKTMTVYCCDSGCGAWQTQMLGRNLEQQGKKDTKYFKHSLAQGPSADRYCEHCGSKTHLAGPMWAGPLHNAVFVEHVLAIVEQESQETYATKDRLEGMLTTAWDELTVNDAIPLAMRPNPTSNSKSIPQNPPQTLDSHPFFFIPSALAKVLHCQAPPEAAIKGALRHAGYRATRSHCKPGSIKTNAPWSVVWEVMREWVRQKSPVKEGAVKEGTRGWRIMQAARKADDGGREDSAELITEETAPAKTQSTELSKIDVVFDEQLGRDKPGKRLLRYQINPRANWGPMNRAKGSA